MSPENMFYNIAFNPKFCKLRTQIRINVQFANQSSNRFVLTADEKDPITLNTYELHSKHKI